MPESLPDPKSRKALARRGDRLQVHLARVELTISDLTEIDRLLVLNTALENVLADSAARDARRRS